MNRKQREHLQLVIYREKIIRGIIELDDDEIERVLNLSDDELFREINPEITWNLTKQNLEDLKKSGRIILPDGNTKPVKLSMPEDYPEVNEKETIINNN
jgi:hypothetical protein